MKALVQSHRHLVARLEFEPRHSDPRACALFCNGDCNSVIFVVVVVIVLLLE